MKKRNFITVLSSLLVIGLFVITAPTLNSCGGSECDHDQDSIACNDSVKAEHNCDHHKDHHDCDHHKNDINKCNHGDKDHKCCDMSKLKEDRIAFNDILTEDEITEIERIKEIFAKIDHDKYESCDQVKEEFAAEFESLQKIVDAHADDFKPVCEKKHEGEEDHKCKDMTEEEMKEHCNQFKIHFLLMDTEEVATEEEIAE